jgi:Fasciclin domain
MFEQPLDHSPGVDIVHGRHHVERDGGACQRPDRDRVCGVRRAGAGRSATIEKLKTDSDLLTSILTYHVVPGRASPAKVVGTHKTVQGADVTVTGEGNGLKVNDAGLVCGGVSTANAQVYMIDTVLMPPAN